MFGMGMPELLLILLVALVVVGPKKLPDLAKSLGKGLRQFRKATDDIKGEFADNDTLKDVMDIKKSFRDTVDSLNPKGILDVEPLVEPKKPEVDYSGRKELFDEIDQEQQALAQSDEAQEHLSAEADTDTDTAAEEPGSSPKPAQADSPETDQTASDAKQDA